GQKCTHCLSVGAADPKSDLFNKADQNTNKQSLTDFYNKAQRGSAFPYSEYQGYFATDTWQSHLFRFFNNSHQQRVAQ
ncbi:MAG: hypothetical protein N6V49_12705, partial [Serratia symbiotica]|nr:hypothetical protein [Serratia symbiotica]